MKKGFHCTKRNAEKGPALIDVHTLFVKASIQKNSKCDDVAREGSIGHK